MTCIFIFEVKQCHIRTLFTKDLVHTFADLVFFLFFLFIYLFIWVGKLYNNLGSWRKRIGGDKVKCVAIIALIEILFPQRFRLASCSFIFMALCWNPLSSFALFSLWKNKDDVWLLAEEFIMSCKGKWGANVLARERERESDNGWQSKLYDLLLNWCHFTWYNDISNFSFVSLGVNYIF